MLEHLDHSIPDLSVLMCQEGLRDRLRCWPFCPATKSQNDFFCLLLHRDKNPVALVGDPGKDDRKTKRLPRFSSEAVAVASQIPK